MFEVTSRRSGDRDVATDEALPAAAMSCHQCRMARAALQWSQTELAVAANVTQGTVSLFERDGSGGYTTIRTMQAALEAAGVIFIGAGETSPPSGAGVRLRELLDGSHAAEDVNSVEPVSA